MEAVGNKRNGEPGHDVRARQKRHTQRGVAPIKTDSLLQVKGK